MTEYKGYQAVCEYDPEAGIWFGEVINTSDAIVFQADTESQLQAELEQSIETYLAFQLKHGKMIANE